MNENYLNLNHTFSTFHEGKIYIEEWGRSQIRVGKKKKYLGGFDKELEATKAYQKELEKNEM